MKIGKIALLIIKILLVTNCTYGQLVKSIDTIDSSKYASIYIYRLNIRESRNNTFRINLADTNFKVKNYTKHIIRIYKEGELKVWSKNETYEQAILKVEFGKEYYIKCGIKSGIFATRPEIIVTNSRLGKADFENISEKKQD